MVGAVLIAGPRATGSERGGHVRRLVGAGLAVVLHLEPHVEADQALAGALLDHAPDPGLVALDERTVE
jgi:hypothetical protein